MACNDSIPAAEPHDITVGMATFGEYFRAEFTIGALRSGHGSLGQQMQIVIVDNSPAHDGATAFREFCHRARCHYVPLVNPVGTAPPRDEIFRHATGKTTVVIDPHVIIPYGGLHHVADHARRNQDDYGLWFGTMLNDDGSGVHATHWIPEWGADLMLGKYGRLSERPTEPVEIPMQGLGMLACRTEAWLGGAPGLHGFSCDEWPIAEKFRQAGRRVLLLPRVEWWHHFRSDRAPFTVNLQDRFEGYFRWFRHLGLDEWSILDRFRPSIGLDVEKIAAAVGDIPVFDPSADWVRNPRQRPVPSLPSKPKQWLNYAEAGLKYLAAGLPKVDDKTRLQRLAICGTCPLLVNVEGVERCAPCGCPVEDKTLWATESCPAKTPYWPALIKPKSTAAADESGNCYHARLNCSRVEASYLRDQRVHPVGGSTIGIDRKHRIKTFCTCLDCGAELEPAIAEVRFKPVTKEAKS